METAGRAGRERPCLSCPPACPCSCWAGTGGLSSTGARHYYRPPELNQLSAGSSSTSPTRAEMKRVATNQRRSLTISLERLSCDQRLRRVTNITVHSTLALLMNWLNVGRRIFSWEGNKRIGTNNHEFSIITINSNMSVLEWKFTMVSLHNLEILLLGESFGILRRLYCRFIQITNSFWLSLL